MLRRFATVFMVALLAQAAPAQPEYPRLSASVTPSHARVGDHLFYKLTIVAPDLTRVSLKEPFTKDADTTWALVNKKVSPDLKLNATEFQRTIDYTITPWKTGTLVPPPIEVHYQPAQGETRVKVADSNNITVDSVLPTDNAKVELKDIKGPVVLPFPRWIIVTAVIAGTLLLAWIVVAVYRRFKGRIQQIVSPPKRLDEWALSELQALEAEKLIEQKKLKELYTRLTDVVRQYLGSLYNFRAMDMTSYELMLHAEQHLDGETREVLDRLLSEADLVKFARFQPEANESRRSIDLGRSIVTATRHLLEPKPDLESQNGTAPPPPPVPPAPPTSGVRTATAGVQGEAQ